MSWNERIKAAREAQKLTREQTVRKMRTICPQAKRPPPAPSSPGSRATANPR